MIYDLALLGGTAVSGGKVFLCDILVSGGKIASVRKHSGKKPQAKKILDLSGMIVLPGIIDSHTHFHLRLGDGWSSDDFDNGSAAAACGGITTFIDYTGQPAGADLVQGLEERLESAEGRTYTDFSFHSQLTGLNLMKDHVKEMKAAVKAGMTTFKMFTAYAPRGLMGRDDEFYKALETTADIGALVCVHCENGYICDLLTDRYAPALGIDALPMSRPAFTEIESVGRVAQIAAATKAPVYFVHLSAGGSVATVQAARETGIQAMAETCPHYLCLSDMKYREDEGWLYSCCPPFRGKENNQPLWNGLDGGVIQSIASDSCSITREMKSVWDNDIRKMPMGIPGSQTLMPSVYTFGVRTGKITLERMVECFCENPARIMGIKNKGFIKKGYDADFAVIDPFRSVKVDSRKLMHNADYSVWQGTDMYGFPVHTILRGRMLVENGKFAAKKPNGKFIKRTTPEIL